MRAVLVFILVSSFAFFGHANAQQNTATSEQEIEMRAHKIGEALRCVVCQNQSIDESNAPLAADMRVMVRERLRSGDSNVQVIDYMRERYGDFVLLKPPLQGNTILLWMAPFFLMCAFLIWYAVQAKRKKPMPASTPLSEEETRQFKNLTQTLEDKS